MDILADRDSYRETPKYRKPQSQTPKQENEGASVKILLTPKESDKVTLLNEARMALADSAAYKNDFTQALGLYSRVKTAKAAWNQAQVQSLMICGILYTCICTCIRHFVWCMVVYSIDTCDIGTTELSR